MDLKQYCQILHETKKSYAFIYQIRKDNLEHEILKNTAFLVDDRISTRVYCILHDVTEIPKCECGNQLRFNQYSAGFHRFCSVKCSSNSDYKQNKIKETNLKKFGHENAFHSPNGRESWNCYANDNERIDQAMIKMSDTLKEKYNVETVREAQQIRMKIALEANIKKHGRPYNNREQAIKNRDEKKMIETLKKTCIEKYGVYNAMQTPEIYNKMQKSAYRKKDYVLPSGKVIKVQGYEPFAINKLLLNFNEEEIIAENKEMPIIWYFDNDNKKHRYYPDIYIPKENKIIEVKSTYTIKTNKELNALKEKACLEAGFNFEFMVFNDKGVLMN